MFCFLNEQNFWALDNVTMIQSKTGNQIIGNGDFEAVNWNNWTPYNTVYYGSGITGARNSWSARSGYEFYIDIQYTIGDGIFQKVSTIIGDNYTISFYLANPYGGNVSVAVVSIAP
jgi:hypothetical protein